MRRLPKRGPLRIALFAGLVVILVIATTGLLAVLYPSRALASSSTLEVLDGVVALSHDGTNFTMGQDGDFVQQGDVVRTGSDSHAVLTFFDGSIIEVEPDSDLIIQTLQASPTGDFLMSIQQNLGRSWHVVSHSLSGNSKYEVRTPSTTASVRGTAFLVSVLANGKTNLQTTEGLVHAVANGEEVQVPPGFETNVEPGTAPDPPTPAPAPAAVVQIVVDLTPNATVTDANGRTVGVLNGLPVRYPPLSTTQVKDGKLIITIPNPTLGKLDTHVQPGDPAKTDVDVNIQVTIGGAVVGNVLEHRVIDSGGVAKGGVVITNNGTFVLPDADARRAADPRIGKLPPAPAGFVPPFADVKSAGPTAIVSIPPSFVPRFSFDPRVAAQPTSSIAPPVPSPAATFNGAFQPFTEVRATTGGNPTPAPNAGITVFTNTGTIPLELLRLTSPTPTPAPTLSGRLTAPVIITTPTATPEASTVLRTFNPAPFTATPAPSAITGPIIFPTATPGSSAPPILLRTLPPTITLPPAFTPPPAFTVPPTETPAPILRTIVPLPIFTLPPTETPAPTIFRTLAPIFSIAPIVTVPPTIAPTPAPTAAPSFILKTTSPIIPIIPPIVIPTTAPTPAPTPVPTPAPTPIKTAPPVFFFPPTQTPCLLVRGC